MIYSERSTINKINADLISIKYTERPKKNVNAISVKIWDKSNLKVNIFCIFSTLLLAVYFSALKESTAGAHIKVPFMKNIE